ncbi:MAG: hypothetical protein ABIN66_09305 [candidate division WOR-3 bacterium]
MRITLNKIREAEGLVQLYLGQILGLALDLPHHPKPPSQLTSWSREL